MRFAASISAASAIIIVWPFISSKTEYSTCFPWYIRCVFRFMGDGNIGVVSWLWFLIYLTDVLLLICPDAGDPETAGIPGCVQEQPGDGGWANLWLWESAGPSPLQQRPRSTARIHRWRQLHTHRLIWEKYIFRNFLLSIANAITFLGLFLCCIAYSHSLCDLNLHTKNCVITITFVLQ